MFYKFKKPIDGGPNFFYKLESQIILIKKQNYMKKE